MDLIKKNTPRKTHVITILTTQVALLPFPLPLVKHRLYPFTRPPVFELSISYTVNDLVGSKNAFGELECGNETTRKTIWKSF